jgi:NDP-sugar pyrophosphorylase family protein
MTSAADLWETIRGLWPGDHGPLASLLPRDAAALAAFRTSLGAFVSAAPRRVAGAVDPGAIVRGTIVSMGPESVVEAGAVVHESCRLVLGARSRVRSGAVLRDDVVVGDDCLVGAHCEVARVVLLGPHTCLGHHVYLADSIVGTDVNVAGNVFAANTPLRSGTTVRMRFAGENIDSGRSHFGALVGNGVRFGASTTLCPGCIVVPGLRLPPGVVLYGTIDAARRETLMRRFFAAWDTDD